MGLFYNDSVAATRNAKSATVGKVIRITEADKQFLGCSQCSLNNERLHHPKMLPYGQSNPLVYFLAEAPGADEDKLGRQLVGKAGQFLFERLPENIDDFARRNNLLRCRPPENRDPLPLELECCRKLQVHDIEETKPQVIVALGRFALQWLLGTDKVMHIWRGRRAPVKVGSHVCWAYFIEDPSSLRQNDRKYGEANVRAFEHDLQRVFDDIERGLPPACVEEPANYTAGIELLDTYGSDGLARVEHWLAHYSEIDHAHDIETNGLRPYFPEAKILTLAIGTYSHTFTYAWEHSEARWSERERRLLHDMHAAYLMGPGAKWAHKASFEMEWWHRKYGPAVIYDTRWEDTLGQAHILDERGGSDDEKQGRNAKAGWAKGLDVLTTLHMGFNVKALSPNVDRKKIAQTPLKYVLPYNGLDTKYTYALCVIQAALLGEQGLQHVYEGRNAATPSIVAMQARGVTRNLPVIEKLDGEMTAQEEAVLATISAHRDVIAYRATGRRLNPQSDPDLQQFFYSHLGLASTGRYAKDDDGKQSVDADALSNLGHPVALAVLKHRGIAKRHGYVSPLKPGGKYVHADGLVHALYSQYIAQSGRLACRDPNEQNYPRRGPEAKVVRGVIRARDGHRFVAFDYRQLEWRIGAALSRDATMIDELAHEADIHGHWTDSLGRAFGPRRLKDDRSGLRDQLKNDWTFSNLYGNSPGAIAYALSPIFEREITERQIMPHYEEFWGRYPRLKQYQDDVMRTYWELGYVETGTGQRRREPLARNEGINHPFQGTAGHLVIDAQARVSRMAYVEERPSLTPIMNIHDDLSFDTPEPKLEEDIPTIARVMLTGLFDFVDVPMSVECSVGTTWADKQVIGVFCTRDFV